MSVIVKIFFHITNIYKRPITKNIIKISNLHNVKKYII